ncbi:MAG TPA: hypothetical protein VEL31_31940 [Ktedonobacteraceae bacterium]|nr:hypothetical protein [Ktedonobacteraceae bacterium]
MVIIEGVAEIPAIHICGGCLSVQAVGFTTHDVPPRFFAKEPFDGHSRPQGKGIDIGPYQSS